MYIAVAYVVCALVWGTTWFAIRVSIAPGGYPVFLSIALRFSLAAMLLAPLIVLGLVRPLPTLRREWLWLAGAGLLNAANYAFVYFGEQHVSGGLAAVLFATMPLCTALLVTYTRTECVSRAQLIGALLSFGGVLVIFADRIAVSTEQAWGVGLVLLGVVVSSIYTLIIKYHARAIHPVASTGVFLSVTAAAVWVATGVSGDPAPPWPPPLAPSLAIAYLGIFGSVVAFATWFYLIKRISLMAASMLTLLLPIIALVMDALWENEIALAGRTYLGIGLTLAGVSFDLVRRSSRRAVVPGRAGSARR